MHVIAIDPGNERSALVVWTGERIAAMYYRENAAIIPWLRVWNATGTDLGRKAPLVIEQICSYGMAVGESVFSTCIWTGRFMEAYGSEHVSLLPRLEVKKYLCHDSRAKDGNIRQAIIDRFGGKDKAIGKKAAPGPLFGVSSHLWAALAVAITWWDQNANRKDATHSSERANV